MKLSTIKAGQSCVITHIEGSGAFRARLSEMGFVNGKTVKLLYKSPVGNPIIFELMGGQVALRKSEANNIHVTAPGETYTPQTETKQQNQASQKYDENPDSIHVVPSGHVCIHQLTGCAGCHQSKKQAPSEKSEKGEVTLALIGNPNCGKTSLFNAASGGHERTGNYSGVTVSSVVGRMTFEGRPVKLVDLPGTYSLRAFSPEEAYVAHELESGKIDAVINVLDATNLERNLLLTLQLKERDIPIVGALNMYDEVRSSGSYIDIKQLGERLDIPFFPTVARNHEGLDDLLRKAIELADAHIALHKSGVQGHTHEAACCSDPEHCQCHPSPTKEYLIRTTAEQAKIKACPCPSREHDDVNRYAHISDVLNGIYEKKDSRGVRITKILDRILAQHWTAYPLFLLIMGFIFWMTFSIGQYPMERAAILADPMMNKMGLHGKSFIPMLMGFGCNVPAVMATRTIENAKSRFITMLVTPMMSCSARIPVYIVFTGAFFASQAAYVMLGLYAFGVIMALLVAWILSKVFMRDQLTHFVMELPPYRMPSYRGVCRHTWEKGRQYLHKMGGIILVTSVIIWALGYFPKQEEGETAAEHQEASYMGQIGHAIEPAIKPLGYDWRMGVGIITGVGAKELMVSTLGVLYNSSDEGVSESEETSQTRLTQVLKKHITSEAALSYMVFALLYFPCIATIAAIKSESGRWKWALFAAVYTTILAYTMAFIVYRVALAF